MLSDEERELWDDVADEIILDLKVMRDFSVSIDMGTAPPLLSSMYVTTIEERAKLVEAVVTTRDGAKRLHDHENAWVWGPRRRASMRFRAMVLASAIEESGAGYVVSFGGVRQLDATIGTNRFIVAYTSMLMSTGPSPDERIIEEWWYALVWEVGKPLEANLLLDTRVGDGPLSQAYGDGEAMQFWELVTATTGLE